MRLRHLFRLLTLAALLLPALPFRSTGQVFYPENDIQAALTRLLPELKRSYGTAVESDSLLVDSDLHKQRLAEMVRSADEVTIGLYTQRPEFAFDMAFALEKVTDVYDDFREQARQYDRYLNSSRAGLRRYTLLDETLRDMYMDHPLDSLHVSDSLLLEIPAPEPLGQMDAAEKALLDSCLRYTGALKDLYGRSVLLALQDSVCYAETEHRLMQAYEFARSNYADTQKGIFVDNAAGFFQIIRDGSRYVSAAKHDLHQRFSSKGGRMALKNASLAFLALVLALVLGYFLCGLILKFVRREDIRAYKPLLSAILGILLFVLGIQFLRMDPSNPYRMIGYSLMSQFFWLTLAILVSVLIRVPGDKARASRNLYFPTLLLAFLIIQLRAILLPASLVPIALPPALVIFIVWQSGVIIRLRSKVERTDVGYTWCSVVVMGAALVLSLVGYAMLGVLLMTFWTFQLALLHTITALYFLMKRYYESPVIRRKVRYREANPNLPLEDRNAYIEVTWMYDLIRMVVVPVACILSVLISLQLTSHAYQLSLTGAHLLGRPLLPGKYFAYLTLSNFLIILTLFFVFRYLIYLVKGLLRVFKLRRIIERKGALATPLKESDVNLSLTNALVTVIGWLLYLIIVFSILHMPMAAITTISTGLAAGVGFALKDLINNFFYGVQLMAGRIRVGDKISCDGVRGIVKRVSYQTTQVEDEDGSLIAFTNTELFTKKFRNLNSGRNYEFLKMPVSVRYGTDIEFARSVILKALKPLMTKDQSGRDIVDPSFPVDVRFDGFGENSINLIVALYSTVETHYTFPSRAKEAIYNAFYENGIQIPFPQREIYVKSVPEEKKD